MQSLLKNEIESNCISESGGNQASVMKGAKDEQIPFIH